MIKKIFEFEAGRRKRALRFGILVGAVSACAAAAVVYALSKNVKKAIDEVKENKAEPADPVENETTEEITENEAEQIEEEA